MDGRMGAKDKARPERPATAVLSGYFLLPNAIVLPAALMGGPSEADVLMLLSFFGFRTSRLPRTWPFAISNSSHCRWLDYTALPSSVSQLAASWELGLSAPSGVAHPAFSITPRRL